MKVWRVLCMLVTAGLLLFGIVIQGHRNWWHEFSCPAKCAANKLHDLGGAPLGWMLVNVVLLAWAYTAALLPIFEVTRMSWESIRQQIVGRDEVTEKYLEGRHYLQKTYKAVRFVVLLTWFSLSSVFIEVVVQVFWFAYGVFFLIYDRNHGTELIESAEEDVWGFGQVVPLILLMLPFMAAAEGWHGEYCLF